MDSSSIYKRGKIEVVPLKSVLVRENQPIFEFVFSNKTISKIYQDVGHDDGRYKLLTHEVSMQLALAIP